MRWCAAVGVIGFYARLALDGRSEELPLAVTSRGQVVDASQSALAGGVRLGTPAAQVARDCPGVRVVSASELHTEAASAALGRSMQEQTPWVQTLAPHQMLLGLGAALAPPVEEARHLLQVAAAHGQAAVVALAASPLTARVALQAALREWLRGQGDGLLIVPAGEEAAFLAPLPLRWLPLPEEMLGRVRRLGLSRIGQVAEVAESYWVQQFGPLGRELYRQACGSSGALPVGRRLPRQMQAELETDELDTTGLQVQLGRWAERWSRQLGQEQQGITRLGLTLWADGGRQVQAVRAFDRPRQEAYSLRQAMVHLLTELLEQLTSQSGSSDPALAVIRVAVEGSGLQPVPWQQMQLLQGAAAAPVDAPEKRLEKTLAALQSRYPARVVGMGPRRTQPRREEMLQHLDPLRWAR